MGYDEWIENDEQRHDSAEKLATIELTEEECSVVEDLRLAAEGYSSEHEMTLRSVADKIDAAKAKMF